VKPPETHLLNSVHINIYLFVLEYRCMPFV
jgi:hypothetical protein